jgi:hypothetical protein
MTSRGFIMSFRPFWLIGTVAVALMWVAPSSLGAQVNLDSLRAAHTCDNALRIVTLGHPDKKEDWAWSVLPSCGTAASPAARDAWLAQRNVADTVQLADVYGRLWSFRDAALFDAAMTIAGDVSAAAPSRVFSVMMLLQQLLDRQFAEYRHFSTTTATGVCRIGDVFDRQIRAGTPLAADARQRARSLAQSLAANSSAPSSVQSAGRCLDQALLIDDKVQASKPIRPPGE